MTDDSGRARRKQLELLQGRLKEAKADLLLEHSEGHLETLAQLKDDALAREMDAATREREARDTGQRLAKFRHDVEEAERQLLVPRTVQTVSPAVVAFALASTLASVVTLAIYLNEAPSTEGYVVMGILSLVPPPLLAWVIRRRLSGGGTFRNPS